MRQNVRPGLRQLRRAGARRGTQAAVREGARLARGVAREARLRTRPLTTAPGELPAALGGLDPVSTLRGPVLQALPTVARFERELERYDDLVERADEICAHRFDLLGSGPTDLGAEIDWHTDFKTGRRWPLRHSSLLPVAYGDGEVRGNHYLTDVVGLLVVSAVFAGGWEGHEWAGWAAGELVSEIEHQVR